MAYVLAVAACEIGDPVAVLVLVKRNDRLLCHLQQQAHVWPRHAERPSRMRMGTARRAAAESIHAM
jgi:hypothetical protein